MMTSRLARRGLIVLAGMAVLIAFSVIALPFVASTQIVQDRIAREFSTWSGYRVTLGGAPDIDVWPSIRAELPNVVLSGWGSGEGSPVLTSEKIEIELSAFSALAGEIVPTRVHFFRPVLWVKRDLDRLPALQSPAGGQIRRAVEAVRVALGDDPIEPDLSDLPSGGLGTVEFTGASILDLSDGNREEAVLVSNLDGMLGWPSFARDLTLRATGEIKDVTARVSAELTDPLVLFAGGTAGVSLTFESDPLNLVFKGLADIQQPSFVDGSVEVSTPSFNELLEWTGTEISTTAPVGKLSLAGNVKGEVNSVKIENAEIVLGQNPGMGLIDVDLGGDVPSVAGTLAFQTLDLPSFLSAFAISPTGQSDENRLEYPGPFGQFNLDLRLSASNVTAGPAKLTDVAAAIQITDKLTTFDLSDATGFGGNLSAGIRIDRERNRQSGELRLLASGIDSGALAAAAGFDRLIPNARGKISVILNGPLASPYAFLKTAKGSISATFDTGTIAGLDLPAFMKRASEGGFFALGEVAGGTLAFERAELKATVASGVATVEKAEAKTSGETITLAGIIPYVGRSLALSGHIGKLDDETVATGSTTFFVGGSWDAPFISAILPPREPK